MTRRIHSSSRGFTLTELLIVIGLIVLLIAMAVPAFNAITGSRSVEAARNKVQAMLGRARNEAINRNAQIGVAFFRDAELGSVGMQLVVVATADVNGAEAYQAWSALGNYQPAAGDKEADRVYALVLDSTEGVAGTGKYVVMRFDAVAASGPSAGGAVTPTLAMTTPWSPVFAGTTSSLDFGVEYLPAGIGCQLVNDPKGVATDKYVQTGMIVFDEQGKLVSTAFSIPSTSALGVRLKLGGELKGNASQLGVMLYEQEQLAGQTDYTPGDYCYYVPTLQPGPTAYSGTSPDESVEETWISNNALHLLVDRYTGTLIKVE
jgi:prepilin-type N-terminal cleavage/methylation domain-containing protein